MAGVAGGRGTVIAGRIAPAPPPPKPPPAPRGVGAAVHAAGSTPAAKAALRPIAAPGPLSAHVAIGHVFAAQSPQKQAALVAKVRSGRVDPGTANAIRSAFKGLTEAQQLNITRYLPNSPGGKSLLGEAGNALGVVGKALSPSSFIAGSGIGAKTRPETAKEAKAFGQQIPGIGSVTPLGSPSTIAKNTVSDAIHLGPQTVQGIYGIGDAAVHGHLSQAAHMLVDPYIHLFSDPGRVLNAHPLDTVAMFAGGEAALGHVGGAVARSGKLGEAVKAAADTTRAPLRLGPDVAGAASPILENRSYSGNLFTKAGQVAAERRLQGKGLDPNVARPKPAYIPKPLANSLNIGLEAKTRRIPDEMTAVRQMGGRESRTMAGQSVKAATPHKSVENIVSHILQGIVRTPETALTDLMKERDRLKANDTGIKTFKTFQNRRQVRDISTAIDNHQHIPEAFRSAEHIRTQLHAADALSVHHGILDPTAAERSRLIPYAMAHMGATYDHELKQFMLPGHRTVDTKSGYPLQIGRTHPMETREVLDHIEAYNKAHPDHPMSDPAYVGHYPGKTSAARFYQAYREVRGSLNGQKRTGEAFRSGGYDHSYNALIAQSARSAEALTKAGLHDKIVNRLGIGKPHSLRNPLDASENGYFTANEAARYAEASTVDHHGNPIPGAQPLVPITAFNAKTPLAAIDHLQHPHDLQHIEGVEQRSLQAALDDAKGRVTEPGKTPDQARNIVLVPHHAIDQFQKQFKPAGGASRKLGQVTQQFRRTVLPYSTHWMTQIGSEALLRSVLTGALDPRNVVAGHQIMHELQKTTEGRDALREMVNATFYNKQDPLAKFNPNPSPTMDALRKTPAGLVMAAHNRYADFIGNTVGKVEHEARVMGLGKFSRQALQEFTKSYQGGIKLQGRNVAMLAEKMRTDPALVARFGRQVDDTFGKYNKLSPGVRATVQTVAPFLPWYLNAAKFVLWNLPVHHPVANALLASLRTTMNQDVADGKQLPLNDFQVAALARFMPFGIYPEKPNLGSAAETALSPFLPQATGAYNVLHGQNAFGDSPLTGPAGLIKAGTSGTVGPAINQALETVLPGLSMLQTGLQGGGKAYGNATLLDAIEGHPDVKPGTSGGTAKIINKIFNPFHALESEASAGGRPSNGAENGKWTLVQSNPAGTHATDDKWKLVAP